MESNQFIFDDDWIEEEIIPASPVGAEGALDVIRRDVGANVELFQRAMQHEKEEEARLEQEDLSAAKKVTFLTCFTCFPPSFTSLTRKIHNLTE